MHRTRKIMVTATAAALLMTAGMSSAMAHRSGDDGNDNENHKITICHATHSSQNPFVRINVSENSAEAHSHHGPGHDDDVFLGEDDANVKQCPTTPPGGGGGGGEDEDGDDCSASSDSGDSTQSQDGLINVGNINLGLNNLLGNAFCQSNVGNGLGLSVIGDAFGGILGDDDDSDDGDCSVESISGDSEQEQEGLINVGNLNLGLNNLLGNGFCGSNVLNGLAVAGIGDAVAGDVGDDSGDGGCTAESFSGDSDQDQDGAVNVGNINVGGNDLLANAFCQADVLNGLAVSLIGPAVGGGSLGSGLLTSGPLGLLSSAGYLVPSITTDVRVVAGLLLSL